MACSPRAIQEAKQTVSQADSLWHAGTPCDDSASLAKAYETLGAIPFLFREGLGVNATYAHSCYHYGRLLRQKENPAEAMQVFINATHSHTRDYHILGRVYSNMGDIAHLAGEFELSYDMFERASIMFLHNSDTVSYYFCLNSMAFELAEQGKKKEALSQLEEIERFCSAKEVLIKTMETNAVLYLKCKQYDSALYYASELLLRSNHYPIAKLVKAQVYSYMSIKDSAVYYAEQVLCSSSNLSDIHNALYILTNDDETKDISAIRKTAAERSDVQLLIRIRKGKLAQAAQLLEQDMNRKPDWRIYILTICAVIGIISFIILANIWKKRRQRMQNQVVLLTDKHADNTIESIKKHIDKTDINTTLHWKNYSSMKIDADLYLGGIVSKLEEKHLNETEIRYCVLTLLDFPQKEKAEILYYGYPSGIKTLKRRTSDKLGTTSPNLKTFLFSMVANAEFD